MKRIEFAFPVEAMRGKLGSDQDLRYAENDNKAFNSPKGKTNYARNYEPRVIGAKVARTGLKYFAVKTKSAFKVTADALRQCALMGATSAIYGITIANSLLHSQLQRAYAQRVDGGYTGTFHKWLSNEIRRNLASNASEIVIGSGVGAVNIGNNPFDEVETAITITSAMLVKFWSQLTDGGIKFRVGNDEGICFESYTFEDFINNSRINVLGLTFAQVGSTDYVKLGTSWLLASDNSYATRETYVSDGEQFTLTDVAPSA